MDFESLLNAAQFRPNRLSFPDAWIGHIPFAGWLIQAIEPSVFVELGTHSGNSYLAFCQAVSDAKLSTKCYAVDTWKGDEHTGYYDDTVFQNLYSYHQEHYEAFSRLLRMTFDDASQYFAEGSIELLHIDGLHTYEAIKHDFETWLPKLTHHAVVLFHDTNVREQGFGVWRFWEELCAQYHLNLQFIHSNGLGVLQLSQGKGTFNLNWLRTGSPHRHLLLNFFSALGERNIEQYQNLELKQSVQALTAQLGEREQAMQALTAQVEAITTHADGLAEQLIQKDQTWQEIINSKEWKLLMIFRKIRLFFFPKNSLQEKVVRYAFAIGRGVIGSSKRILLFLKRNLSYLQKNGLKETFITIAHRMKRRSSKVKLDASTRASLQKVLKRLNIPLESEQVLSALVIALGKEKTRQIMTNIVGVEKFLSAPGKREIFSLIQTSELSPAPPNARKKNILFITGEFPSPYHGGGNRVLNFIKTLSENNNIYLCTSFFTKEHENDLPVLASYCQSILKIPHWRFGGNQAEIRNWIGRTSIDIVHYEWPRSLENYDPGFGKIQIFTYMEAVSLRLLMDMDCLTPLTTDWLEKFEQLAYVLHLEFVCASRVSARVAVTRKDAEFFRNLYPFQKYAILNHGLDFEEFTLPDIEPEPHSLVFVGNYRHYPNVDALEFFFREVWDNIRKDIPDISINIVGAYPPENITRMADGKHIFVTGTVEDVRPYIQKASVCIAPLKTGAGERGKVIEYAAMRRPFVATSLATTDLVFKDGIDYFCGDTALEFSEKVIALLKDPKLAKQMAETAYETARHNYNNQLLKGFLLSLYEYVEDNPDVK